MAGRKGTKPRPGRSDRAGQTGKGARQGSPRAAKKC